MEIISRAEWGARYASSYRNYDAPLPADEVWLHHSVTIAPDLVPPWTDDYAAIRALEQIGQNRFGWGMSYTWPITPAGLIFEGHRVDGVGTHTGGRNSRARAICFVGNYETDQPTNAQIEAAAWLLRHAHSQGWIKHPRLNGGHQDLKATKCPGQHAYNRIDDINRLAATGPIGGGGAPGAEDDMPLTNEEIERVARRAARLTWEYPTTAHLDRVAGRRGVWAQDRLTNTTTRVVTVLKKLAEHNGVTAADIADALAPQLSAELLPVIGDAVETVLGADNRDQAEAIVAELGRVLAAMDENTEPEGADA